MSEERVIRINKVLRELNISLERAVDYLKDNGIAIDANPNAKISDAEFGILQNQFAGDKGNKEASKEVGEEKRKEKEALRIEREKEIEDKRKHDEERQRQQEVIKARAVVTGPKQVGTIDLNPKKAAPVKVETPAVAEVKTEVTKAETPKTETPKAEIPKTETPKVETPKVEAPKEKKPSDKKEQKEAAPVAPAKVVKTPLKDKKRHCHHQYADVGDARAQHAGDQRFGRRSGRTVHHAFLSRLKRQGQ